MNSIDLSSLAAAEPSIRHDWTRDEAAAIYHEPFANLMFRAQTIHRQSFDPNAVQCNQLLNVKTGGCAEDCGYCSQSAHHDTALPASKLMDPAEVIAGAKAARDAGATRYCMGAAWREPKDRDMAAVVEMVRGVKALGMETCMTLGMLSNAQAGQLADAGLDYYNHNLDTSEAFYSSVVTTRTYGDRLDTIARVHDAGIKVCCGGILGLGEKPDDRIDMLCTLANLAQHPESVPINMLIPIAGTPIAATASALDPFDFVRTIALARIMMPKSDVRIAAGRTKMSDEMQALCFLAGANSIFIGDTLLTTPNPGDSKDRTLFARLGITPRDDLGVHADG